jgi:hypothetical protein
MDEVTGRKGAVEEERLRRAAEEHILCAPYTTRGLARRLGVSVPTTSRLLAKLRKSLAGRGAELVSVRRGRAWHYEIRETEAPAASKFARLRGFVRRLAPAPGDGIDDVIYSGR